VHRLRIGGALALAALLIPAAIAAQTVTFQGRAIHQDGEPLAGVEVLAHAVTPGRGGELAGRDTTDADGRFAILVTPTPEALVFAAIRRTDTMYVGPPVRLAEGAPDAYLLVVSPQTGIAFDAAAAAAPRGGFAQPPPEAMTPPARGAWPWIIGLLLAVGGWRAFRRYRMRRDPEEERRWLLVEIAELDERFADRQDLEPGARAEYLRRRAQLERQLVEGDRAA
jgi:hypothetical protein